MNLQKLALILLLVSTSNLLSAQHSIKVRKTEKIEGLYHNSLKKTKLPAYFFFTKDGNVYYSLAKKMSPKRALVKLTLCALDSTCNQFPKTTYSYKKGHIRFTTVENVNNNYFIIYDGQLSDNQQKLSIRKEETNQLITVNQYYLITPKE
ncbi:MAG: hypothetical protein N4A35_09260 [Flavobacteriales bacterium]|jgi:hypothetical protein|nr:hypothetical protein [Flavobacteriales bacterium]